MSSPEICNESGVVIDSELEESNNKLKAEEGGSILEGNTDSNASKHEDSHD